MARRIRKSRADNQRWNQLVASLRLMNMSFNNVRIYPPSHSEVLTPVTKLLETLNPVLEEQEDVGFGFMEELLYLEGTVSLEETANNQMLVDRFNKCRVKYMIFRKGLTRDDLLTFFQILNAEATKPATGHVAELLDQKGVKTIHLVEAEIDDVGAKSKAVRKKTLLDWYKKAVDILRSTQDALRRGAPAELNPLFRVLDDMIATIRSKGHEPFLLLPWLAGDMDPHVCHGVNVGLLACSLGELYGLNSGEMNTLSLCAVLHDLGRTLIPIDWKKVPIPLNVASRSAVAQHADWGCLLLTQNAELPLQAGLLAAHHHDPTASPADPGGYAPDIFHKILAIADAYDLAAASENYYWRKHRPDRILKRLLKRRNVPYDPVLAKLLARCVGYYPIGSLVLLDDGQKGVVVRANPIHPARPKVYLFEAPEAPAEGQPPAIVDLTELDDAGLAYRRSVTSVLPCPAPDLRGILERKTEYLLDFSV